MSRTPPRPRRALRPLAPRDLAQVTGGADDLRSLMAQVDSNSKKKEQV
jgi:hypothetical protein